jgi:hypothetical protein
VPALEHFKSIFGKSSSFSIASFSHAIGSVQESNQSVDLVSVGCGHVAPFHCEARRCPRRVLAF